MFCLILCNIEVILDLIIFFISQTSYLYHLPFKSMGIIWEEGNQGWSGGGISGSRGGGLKPALGNFWFTKFISSSNQKQGNYTKGQPDMFITRVDQGTIKINTYYSSSAAMIGSFLAPSWINSGHGNNQFFWNIRIDI